MQNFGPNIDLEKPYQDACAAGDEHEKATVEAAENIWLELAGEDDAEKFIDKWLADPHKLLRDIVVKVAQAKEQAARVTGSPADKKEERRAIRLTSFWEISKLIEEHVDSVAEHKAEETLLTEDR